MRINISPYENRVLWVVLRQTYGWRKKEDSISFSQIAKKTGLDRRLAARGMKGLITKNIVIKRDDSFINKYRFNKDFETWKNVIRKDTSVRRDDRVSSKKMSKLSSVKTTTKNNKNTITKNTLKLIEKIIGYLNEKTGKAFRTDSEETIKRISIQVNKGRKWEDFRHVVDVKVSQWLGDPKRDKWLRPSTLFGDNFENYLNERFGIRDNCHSELLVGKESSGPKYLPEEKICLPQIDKEYQEKLKEAMKEEGWESEDDIDHFKIPTLDEYRRRRLREIKKAKARN